MRLLQLPRPRASLAVAAAPIAFPLPTRVAVSVVLPTYNEASSIVRLLEELRDVLERTGLRYEVFVMDDASPDGTADVVAERFSADDWMHVIRRSGPRGLAAAIRQGLEAARGDVLVVMDADFNHDPQVLPRLIKYVTDFDLVSGSRFAPGGGMYSRTRQAGSFAMNLFARLVLQTQIQDNLSGYFAVRREQLETLPKDRIFWGYGDYYLRLLWYARRQGCRILEVPVVYRSREGGGSKTPLLRTAWRYGLEILRFAVRH
jgi:dolichol-phosphate mannosyltransferase